MSSAPRVANKDARAYVINKRPFKGSNTFGEFYHYGSREHDGSVTALLYVVFSYARHWPLFVYDFKVDQWFSNCDKYSPSTSKHHTQLSPHEATIPLSVEQMRHLINCGGYAQMTQRRLTA